MRDTVSNPTCYDCTHCVDRIGTSHGFCEVRKTPVGGLEWSAEDFDRFFAHIMPRYAVQCRDFEEESL